MPLIENVMLAGKPVLLVVGRLLGVQAAVQKDLLLSGVYAGVFFPYVCKSAIQVQNVDTLIPMNGH